MSEYTDRMDYLKSLINNNPDSSNILIAPSDAKNLGLESDSAAVYFPLVPGYNITASVVKTAIDNQTSTTTTTTTTSTTTTSP